MKYVRLAPNARRVHQSPEGSVTKCGRHVPQIVDPLSTTRSVLYATSKKVFSRHSCFSCLSAKRRRVSRPASRPMPLQFTHPLP